VRYLGRLTTARKGSKTVFGIQPMNTIMSGIHTD
jgi:hypothetical protein